MSERTYGNRPGEPRLNGMILGKADVPQLATHQSDICMKTTHKALAPGLIIQGVNPRRRIEHHDVTVVSDADGHVSGDSSMDDPVKELAALVQKSGQFGTTQLRFVGRPRRSIRQTGRWSRGKHDKGPCIIFKTATSM